MKIYSQARKALITLPSTYYDPMLDLGKDQLHIKADNIVDQKVLETLFELYNTGYTSTEILSSLNEVKKIRTQINKIKASL